MSAFYLKACDPDTAPPLNAKSSLNIFFLVALTYLAMVIECHIVSVKSTIKMLILFSKNVMPKKEGRSCLCCQPNPEWYFSSGAGMYVRYFVPEMKPARWHRKIIGVFSGNYKTIDANGQTKIVSFFEWGFDTSRKNLNSEVLGRRQYKYSFIITYSRR